MKKTTILLILLLIFLTPTFAQNDFTGTSSYFTKEQMENDLAPESKFHVKVLYYEQKKKFEIYSNIKLVYTLYQGEFLRENESSISYKARVYENDEWYNVQLTMHGNDFAVVFEDGSLYYYRHY